MAEVEIDVEAGLVGAEGFARSASDTGTGTSSSLKRTARRPFWVWPEPARDLPVCWCAAAR